MNKEEIEKSIEKAYGMLKDFQRSTVDHVIKNLLDKQDPEDRHLVADEVGLGKTIVAKGVIAKMVKRQLMKNGLDFTFKVVYICSNQAIARQNLHKLNILGNNSIERPDLNRLVFLALKDVNENNGFEITALTPSTSFKVKKGTGIRDERKLIWTLLTHYQVFRESGRDEGLKLVMLGTVTKISSWLDEVANYKKNNLDRVDTEIRMKFKKKIKDYPVDLNKYRYQIIKKELNYRSDTKSLQSILIDYSEILTTRNVRDYKGPSKLLGLLRNQLTDICTEKLNADLFILDEFQRFKQLIETERDEEKLTDAARIAKKVFDQKDAKVLMLSATPFKPYSTSLEEQLGESHFDEFKIVLKFLLKDENEVRLENFEKLNKIIREILRRPELFDKKSSEGIKSKEELESIYRKVLSRTERLIATDNKNELVDGKNGSSKNEIKRQDIEYFQAVDNIAQLLKEKNVGGHFNMMGYVNSSPYAFSYLDRYKVKDDLKIYLDENTDEELKTIIKSNKKAWLDISAIEKYELNIAESPSMKLRQLRDIALSNKLWKQLWLPPSLPYYPSQGAYKGSVNSSKILLFSKWSLVPRMVSSLISYEVERLTAEHMKSDSNESSLYFQTSDNRKPRPILNLQTEQKSEGIKKANTMRTFTILYPSLTLCDITSVRDQIIGERNSLEWPELKSLIKDEVKNRLKKADLGKYADNSKEESPDWYWAAPVLLDKFYNSDIYDEWLGQEGIKNTMLYGEQDSEKFGDAIEMEGYDKSTQTSKLHINELIKLYNDPENYNLGKMPDIDKLSEALTLMVLGSPANVFFRTLDLFYPTNEDSVKFQKLNYALDGAYEFRSLFDKPESISIIRNFNSLLESNLDHSNIIDIYWFYVLQYCVDGNLQAVIDEYGHTLISESENLQHFFERFIKTINIRTSVVKVDDADGFLKNKNKSLRCHFAVPFGNQDMETETGQKRVQNVLENFNSPFRPFLLASTSLGQEGLDFHHYCRKVVHWNLPHNPIDIEQREGRVNRYKSLAIRQLLVQKYQKDFHLYLNSDLDDIWEFMFNRAHDNLSLTDKKPDLIPYWYLENNEEENGKERDEQVNIERIVPLLPFSKEIPKFKELLTTLAFYRLTFGQPRQEELVHALSDYLSESQISDFTDNMMINLCPWLFSKE